jgi:hypothetical protein
MFGTAVHCIAAETGTAGWYCCISACTAGKAGCYCYIAAETKQEQLVGTAILLCF